MDNEFEVVSMSSAIKRYVLMVVDILILEVYANLR